MKEIEIKIKRDHNDEKILEKVKSHDGQSFTAIQIAKECGVSAHKVRKKLRFLCCLKIVEKTDNNQTRGAFEWRYIGGDE